MNDLDSDQHELEVFLQDFNIRSTDLANPFPVFQQSLIGLLKAFLNRKSILASGALIVPQIGSQAGIATHFFTATSLPNSQEIQKVASKIISQTWSRQPPSPSAVEIVGLGGSQHLTCVTCPVLILSHHVIGFIWAVVSDSSCDHIGTVRADLLRAAACISVWIREQKATYAFETLSRISLLGKSTSDEIACEVVKACMEALGSTASIIWKLDESEQVFRTLAASDAEDPEFRVDIPVGKGVVGHCITIRKTILVDDLLDKKELANKGVAGIYNTELVRSKGWHSAIFVPLLTTSNEVLGVLATYGHRPGGFTSFDKAVAQAFAERFTAAEVLLTRISELTSIENRISLILPAIQSGMLAMERVHNVDNSLTKAQNDLSILAQTFNQSKKSNTYHRIMSASGYVDYAHKAIKVLVRKAKLSQTVPSKVDLGSLIGDILARYQLQAKTQRVSLTTTKIQPDIFILADRDQLDSVFSNLIDNALYWLAEDRKGGKKKITIFAAVEDGYAVVKFKDNGPGIETGMLKNIFDVFCTTKGNDKGMGFGLAIAKRIMDANRGTIEAHSRWGWEAEFTVRIPLAEAD